MKTAFFGTAMIALALTASSAEAKTRHHAQLHPMVQGLGIGLAHMLNDLKTAKARKAQADSYYAGPGAMTTYQGGEEYGEAHYNAHRGGSGYPNLVDVPPHGWPLQPFPKGAHVALRHGRPQAYSVARREGGLDAACRSAARQGGPCGCWAQEHFFGSSARLYNGANLWMARTWAQVFPHVAAAPGTAAVWPNGHHVAPVIAVNGDGTVTVHDSWGDHAVRATRLTFVNPHAARYAGAI
jgi:hypothetical protein